MQRPKLSAAPSLILAVASVAVIAAVQQPTRMSEGEALTAVAAEGDAQASRGLLSGALLVARCDTVLLEKVWGQADRARQLPMTIDTRMRLGSMNKMFTAVAILQLEEQGRIALDQPFGKYLRGYPNADAAARVTIRHLLTHTGGTGDIFGPQFVERRLSLREHADYVQLYGARPLLHEPGAEWRYSNYGYVLLGRVIEAVTGTNYYDHVRTRIFAPAGMRLTDSLPEVEAVATRSVGYTRRQDQWIPNGETLPWRGTAAGGGYSTVGDLLRFARALEAGTLLSTASVAKATTVHANGYGLGFIIQGEGTLRNYGHSGGAPGMNGELRIYPALGYVVAALSNVDPPAASNLVRHLRQRLPDGPADGCREKAVAGATSPSTQQSPASRFANINPAWSPDGTRLLFQSERSGGTDIYVMNADGTGLARLTDHPAADTHARWSPDGRQFVFDSERDGAWHIYLANADGSNVRRITTPDQARNGSAGRHPDWSRDGTSLVFDSNRDDDDEIYVSSLDGTKQQRVTTSPGRDGHPVWSPDSKRILFGSARAGNNEIFAVGRDGGTPVNLSRHAASDLGGKWSPDGTRIVFTSTRDGSEDIFTMNADGSGAPVNLMKHPDIVYESDWSPDGRHIAFYSNRGGDFEIFVMRTDGSDLRQLTGKPQR